MRRLTAEEVRPRFDKLCGDGLTYDLSEYKNTQEAITFTCKKCGRTFKRDLNALTYNNTCPHCNGKQRNIIYTTDEWVAKAKEIHGGKYDYSKVEYKKSDDKVCVVCREKDMFGDEHGEFWVCAKTHIGIHKIGCPKCSGKHKKTTEEFIREANYVHNDFYDYSKTEYKNASTKVCITCPEHGDFWQTPNSHLSGQGCPVCRQSVCERQINRLLRTNSIKFIPQYKTEYLRPLSLDFFLPDYNIGIEVQGTQHFKPLRYYGGEETLKKVQERDERKLRLCNEHGISLLYYSELKMEFPYEVITTPEKLLEEIERMKDETLND